MLALINKFLAANTKTYCKYFKRNVLLRELPDALLDRKQSATHRLQCFFVAIDILKNTKQNCRSRVNNGDVEHEIVGLDANQKKVYIHLREEKTAEKNRILIFASCY